MKKVTIKIIDKIGFFVDVRIELPNNLAKIVNGLNKMCDDGILQYKPHLDTKNKRNIKKGIFKISVDTTGVNNDIIKEIKKIAINEKCNVTEDTTYSWLTITNKKETINHYFE